MLAGILTKVRKQHPAFSSTEKLVFWVVCTCDYNIHLCSLYFRTLYFQQSLMPGSGHAHFRIVIHSLFFQDVFSHTRLLGQLHFLMRLTIWHTPSGSIS